MSEQQHKKLVFLRETMDRYGIGERAHKIAQHAFRHLHYEILGRIGFYCDICVAGRKEIEQIMQEKGRSYEVMIHHSKI